jgi:trimethylamine--corrinoid protein Co-methyltransferase
MVANTIKPLVILVSDEKLFSPTLDLLETLHGDLNANPFIVPYVNPITPLILNKGAADKMREAIGRGLPVIYSNYSMAGMSTPITSAGTLSLLNAELLVGLVFSQLVKSGAPIILGSLPAFFDMKTMLDYYEPQTFLINLACAEMMAHYRIPHCGTSGSGRGWGPDLSASSDLWMNHLTSCIGKVGLAPFVGGSLGSKVFSATSVVVADEIITEALRFAQGFALDDETAALNEIDVTGPGGSFLTSELTLKLFRKAHYTSKIYPRISLEKWEASGRPQAIDLLRDHTQQLLAKLNPLDDSADLVGRGEVFIRKFAVRPQE